MGDKTKVIWADASWNPVTGCTHAGTPACDNCYARVMARRLKGMGQANYRNEFKVTCHPHMLGIPFGWKKPRKIFTVSMGDLFHEDVSNEFIAAVFAVAAACNWHIFQFLTKRTARALEWFKWMSSERSGTPPWIFLYWHLSHLEGVDTEQRWVNDVYRSLCLKKPKWPLPNVWFGATAENEDALQMRAGDLVQVDAAIRYLSVEPMLSPVNIEPWAEDLDWIICGGESGPKARPMHPDWVRSLRDQCAKDGIPFLFKQWGEWAPVRVLDDVEIQSVSLTDHGIEPQGIIKESHEEMKKIGKHEAGNELDGKIHLEYPEVQP